MRFVGRILSNISPSDIFPKQLLQERFQHQCLGVTLEFVVWIQDTFDNNLKIKNYFAKYLKESWLEGLKVRVLKERISLPINTEEFLWKLLSGSNHTFDKNLKIKNHLAKYL